MADMPDETNETPRKSSKIPLIIGLVLACLGGGAGYYATTSGLIFNNDSDAATKVSSSDDDGTVTADVAYVEIDPLTISLRAPSTSQYLRFRASLEVVPSEADAVKKLLPRVTDVLNNYLRALEPADLEDPSALARLRGQMLRRIQVITGLGKVNDLLIMEFVLN